MRSDALERICRVQRYVQTDRNVSTALRMRSLQHERILTSIKKMRSTKLDGTHLANTAEAFEKSRTASWQRKVP